MKNATVRNPDRDRTHLLDADMVHQDQRVYCRDDQLDIHGQEPIGARIALLIHRVSRQRGQLPEQVWQWMTRYHLQGSLVLPTRVRLLPLEEEPRNQVSNHLLRRLLRVLQSRYSLQDKKMQVRHAQANRG